VGGKQDEEEKSEVKNPRRKTGTWGHPACEQSALRGA
jgi:hypothetical protein